MKVLILKMKMFRTMMGNRMTRRRLKRLETKKS